MPFYSTNPFSVLATPPSPLSTALALITSVSRQLESALDLLSGSSSLWRTFLELALFAFAVHAILPSKSRTGRSTNNSDEACTRCERKSASAKYHQKEARRSDNASESGEDEASDDEAGARKKRRGSRAEPEEAVWDKDTSERQVVWCYLKKQEVERRIAFPSHLIALPDNPTGFKFQKVFGDASFVATGMLEIPEGRKKPSKSTLNNTYVFYVIQGAVIVKVHRTSFIMAVGGQFMVPRGNRYSLRTISQGPAKLFFAQARRLAAEEEEEVEPETPNGKYSKK